MTGALKALYNLLNLLALALYGLGHAAVGTFYTNTRIVGTRDTRIKGLAILLNWIAWPLGGAAAVLLSAGGPKGFVLSLFRPWSWRWAWRAVFTFIGARYLAQEIYAHRHPRPRPARLLSASREDHSLTAHVARVEGAPERGLRRFTGRFDQKYELELVRYELRFDRLPPEFDGFTIAQLTDLHYGGFTSAEFVRCYVALATGESPDLIALTGDFQHYPKDVLRTARLLAPIGEWAKRGQGEEAGRAERSERRAVAVLGNHDTWSGTPEVTHALRQVGIEVLRNKSLRLRRGDASIYLAGIADPWSLRADMDRTLHEVPPGAFTILLCHVPDLLADAARRGVDFQLSGHLHGGQITFPLVGPVLSPSRYNRRYVSGFYTRERTLMYVSRGLGGHPSMRLGARPELTLFTLRSGQK